MILISPQEANTYLSVSHASDDVTAVAMYTNMASAT